MNNTKHFQKTVVAGHVVEVFKYSLNSEMSTERCNRCKPTTPAQAACNLKKATQRLSWLIAENFGMGSSFVRLSYEGEEPTEAEAQKALENFLRTMRRKYKYFEFKYISKTERGEKSDRIHHHLLISSCPDIKSLITGSWKHGSFNIEPVREDEGYHKALASYFTKTKGSSPAMKQLYNCSHNLSKPQIAVKEITEEEFVNVPESTFMNFRLVENSFESSVDCFGNAYCCYFYQQKRGGMSRTEHRELQRTEKQQGRRLCCAGYDEYGDFHYTTMEAKKGCTKSKKKNVKAKSLSKKARRKNHK